MPSVLIDTSEWGQYFRVPESAEAVEVERLLESKETVIVGMVYAELVRGARNATQLETLEDVVGGIRYIETTRDNWSHAGRILSELDRQGLPIPLADALIAALALDHGLSVFSRDEHFRRVPGLDVHTING